MILHYVFSVVQSGTVIQQVEVDSTTILDAVEAVYRIYPEFKEKQYRLFLHTTGHTKHMEVGHAVR